MSAYVCIDIGGTAIKYGLADEQGVFQAKGSCRTEIARDGAAALPAKIASIVQTYREQARLSGIAICSPGVVEAEKGEIIFAGRNFPGYTGMKLKEKVEAACHLPCTVANDVNAAGLGESWLGAGRGAQSVFCLFVGTGIGGSLIIDGQLINGAGFSAGEVGFLRLGGMAGTLEETSSAAQLVREVAAGRGIQPDSLDGEMIFAGAAKGEPDAVQAIDGMVQRLAQGIAAICYVVDPAVFIIGGGIMAQQAYLEPRLAAALAAEMVPAIRGHMQLAFAQLGNDAGMLGALRNFLQRQ